MALGLLHEHATQSGNVKRPSGEEYRFELNWQPDELTNWAAPMGKADGHFAMPLFEEKLALEAPFDDGLKVALNISGASAVLGSRSTASEALQPPTDNVEVALVDFVQGATGDISAALINGFPFKTTIVFIKAFSQHAVGAPLFQRHPRQGCGQA